ncbi:MAG: hypothetical protein ACI4U5_06460 [Bacilli bacterium]
MKAFRCEKCGKVFSLEEKSLCPHCKNNDLDSINELSEEEASILLASQKKRKDENLFHIILFSSLLLIIIVLTILSLVLR